jgi:hypothetical protein
MKYFKLAIIILLLIYFLNLSFQSNPQTILWFIDVLTHEAGHFIFSVFGQFFGVLGGSLNQILIPLLFVGYFFFQRQHYSLAIVLFWVGENFLSVAAYAGDAVKMQLPLLGGDSSIHDWNWLLTNTGLIDHTSIVASILKIFGLLTILTSGVLGIIAAFSEAETHNN